MCVCFFFEINNGTFNVIRKEENKLDISRLETNVKNKIRFQNESASPASITSKIPSVWFLLTAIQVNIHIVI